MSEDRIGYNAMVEEAMRSVVRKAVELAASEGLPGEHHFYITFRTDHPDAQLPDHLHKRYPREMTIVLQHQFWNLSINDEALEVDLSFNQKLERLRVPLDALITFADPSVNFGLQFHPSTPDEDEEEDILDISDDETAEPSGETPPPAETAEEAADGEGRDADNVVTLDAFRKK
ncbi:SspB family protein [Hwanghaeella sp.]|uniref:SspB family protein n=1 Tax=Hwanghaeella sp. TaxID=2605943 RepID=UPI003CCC212D